MFKLGKSKKIFFFLLLLPFFLLQSLVSGNTAVILLVLHITHLIISYKIAYLSITKYPQVCVIYCFLLKMYPPSFQNQVHYFSVTSRYGIRVSIYFGHEQLSTTTAQHSSNQRRGNAKIKAPRNSPQEFLERFQQRKQHPLSRLLPL